MKIIEYKPRFIDPKHVTELLNLWHLSHVPHNEACARLKWTSEEFNKLHPNYSVAGIYKDLDCQLSFNVNFLAGE